MIFLLLISNLTFAKTYQYQIKPYPFMCSFMYKEKGTSQEKHSFVPFCEEFRIKKKIKELESDDSVSVEKL